jgi:hypothetical protein
VALHPVGSGAGLGLWPSEIRDTVSSQCLVEDQPPPWWIAEAHANRCSLYSLESLIKLNSFLGEKLPRAVVATVAFAVLLPRASASTISQPL